MTYDIIDTLDQISESSTFAAVSVADALLCEYDKLLTLADSELFMEGDIWNTATGKGKVENGFMKAIMFIPRLFGAIITAITSVFKKDSKDNLDSRFANAEKTLATATSSQLKEISDDVKRNSKGEVVFDPNKKEFFIKRGVKHLRNLAFIVMGLPKAFGAIKRRLLHEGPTPYDSMVKELKACIKGDKSLDSETFFVSIDGLRDIVKNGYNASMGIRGLSSELSMMLEKKMHKDFDNGKNIDKYADAKALMDEINKASKHVMSFTGLMRPIMFVIDKLGGRIMRDHRFRNDVEYTEKETLKQQKRELKRRIQAKQHEYKSAASDKQRKDRLRKDILKLEKQIKDLEDKYVNASDAAFDRRMRDEDADEAWNTIDQSTGEKQHDMNSSILEDNPASNLYRDVVYGGT